MTDNETVIEINNVPNLQNNLPTGENDIEIKPNIDIDIVNNTNDINHESDGTSDSMDTTEGGDTESNATTDLDVSVRRVPPKVRRKTTKSKKKKYKHKKVTTDNISKNDDIYKIGGSEDTAQINGEETVL